MTNPVGTLKWPSAIAGLRNDTLILVDDQLSYHRPDSQCALSVTGQVVSVSLAQAIVWCRPCPCWHRVGVR